MIAPANDTTRSSVILRPMASYPEMQRTQMLNAELTIVRPRVYVFLVDNLSAEVVHGVSDV